MKQIPFAVGFLGLSLLGASSQTLLYTSEGDFSGWLGNGFITVSPASSPDLDGNLSYGLGNAGGTPLGGSLQLSLPLISYSFAFSQLEQDNAPFMAAMENGSAINVRYTKPPPGAGIFFQIGLVLNYDSHFDQLFGTEVNNGDGTFTASVPYDRSAIIAQAAGPGITYFNLGLIYNSNYDSPSPFYVDQISVTPVPEPTSLTLSGLGLLFLVVMSRRTSPARQN